LVVFFFAGASAWNNDLLVLAQHANNPLYQSEEPVICSAAERCPSYTVDKTFTKLTGEQLQLYCSFAALETIMRRPGSSNAACLVRCTIDRPANCGKMKPVEWPIGNSSNLITL
jgi:hypothetical protein